MGLFGSKKTEATDDEPRDFHGRTRAEYQDAALGGMQAQQRRAARRGDHEEEAKWREAERLVRKDWRR